MYTHQWRTVGTTAGSSCSTIKARNDVITEKKQHFTGLKALNNNNTLISKDNNYKYQAHTDN